MNCPNTYNTHVAVVPTTPIQIIIRLSVAYIAHGIAVALAVVDFCQQDIAACVAVGYGAVPVVTAVIAS
jgi:hypothetical protein